jgi:hypothetical protein
MAGVADSDCPACGATAGEDAWCGLCGLDLRSEDARRLRHLASVLAATEVEFERLRARRDGLAAALTERRIAASRLFEAPAPGDPTPGFAPPMPVRIPMPTMPRGPGGEWGVDRVRNLLLWTGATLLALSAVAFTAVAWSHLGPSGRAVLLVVFTAVSAVLASASQTRLPATSGAFTGLTIALALVDWQVARRAGAAGTLSTAAWWAIGLAVVGALSVGLGRVAAPVPARRAIAVLVPGSAFLTVIAAADAAWSAALGFAMIACALAAADRFAGALLADRVVGWTVRVAAAIAWIVGAVLAVVATFGPATFVQTLVPAGVMLALAAAPAVEVIGPQRTGTRAQVGAFLVMLAGIAAVLTAASTSVGPVGLLTLAAVLGSGAVAAAPSLAPIWRSAAQMAGVAAAGAGFVFAFVEAAVCELGPLAWLGHAWAGSTRSRALRVIVGPHTTADHVIGWCAVGIFAAAAGGILIASAPGRRARLSSHWRLTTIGLALAALIVAPIAAGATALVALAVAAGAMVLTLIGSAIATRRDAAVGLVSGVLVLIPAFPLAGWAALTRATSVTVLAIAVSSALVAAVLGHDRTLRAAHAGTGALATIVLASVATLAAGSTRPVAAFVGALAAGGVLLVGTFLLPDTIDGLVVESVGGAGIAASVLLAVPSRAWIAAALTAMVPVLLGASARRSRNVVYGVAAGTAALGATWMWLAAAGVTVVEAYTLPAAALAFAAGTFVSDRVRAWSWLSLGSAIVLFLAPTIGLAIVRHDDGRAIMSGIAALAIVLVGARRQLQAPLVLGAVALFVLGVDKLGPPAARLPRWTLLAGAGVLLLWVGTTFERRRDEMSRAARRLAGLR